MDNILDAYGSESDEELISDNARTVENSTFKWNPQSQYKRHRKSPPLEPKVRVYVSKRRKKVEENSAQEKVINEKPITNEHDGSLAARPFPLLNIPSRIQSTLEASFEHQTINSQKRFGAIPIRQYYHLPKDHVKGVNAIKWCGAFGQVLASASMDGTVRIWDVFRSKKCALILKHDGAVKDVQWDGQGKNILSGGYDKLVKLTDLETGTTIHTFSHPQFITSLRYHPINSHIFVSGMSKDGIISWDTRSHKLIKEFRKFWGSVNDLEFLPDGGELVTCSDYVVRNSADKNIVVWDFESATSISNQIYQEAFSCTALRIHPLQRHFTAQSNANYIAIFSIEKPWKLDKRKRFEGHYVNGHPIRFNFSPEPDQGRYLASGDSNGGIFFYEWSTSKIVKTIENAHHQAICTDISWHPVLRGTMASCGWDGSVRIWE
ncbi:hypothetical protein G9A89_011737 [Geosiphon pyriformis]|nr:hypothetical protein G9A89_011737 [Geosiphon pyriformis]